MLAKTRSIHSADLHDPRLADLPLTAALTFAYLPHALDDDGRAAYEPRVLNALLWPLRQDEHSSEQMTTDLRSLVEAGLLCAYEISGVTFLHQPDWTDRQRLARPVSSDLPRCPVHDQTTDERLATLVDQMSAEMHTLLTSASVTTDAAVPDATDPDASTGPDTGAEAWNAEARNAGAREIEHDAIRALATRLVADATVALRAQEQPESAKTAGTEKKPRRGRAKASTEVTSAEDAQRLAAATWPEAAPDSITVEDFEDGWLVTCADDTVDHPTVYVPRTGRLRPYTAATSRQSILYSICSDYPGKQMRQQDALTGAGDDPEQAAMLAAMHEWSARSVKAHCVPFENGFLLLRLDAYVVTAPYVYVAADGAVRTFPRDYPRAEIARTLHAQQSPAAA